MVNVVNLVAHSSRNTYELGLWLMEHCEEIAGSAVTVEMRDGARHTSFTGIYKRDPAAAVGATLQLSLRLAEAANSAGRT